MIRIGIDEAGRGPWAGPLAIGGLLYETQNAPSLLKHVKDSKKLAASRREIIFNDSLRDYKYKKCLLVDSTVIDVLGLSLSLKYGASLVTLYLLEQFSREFLRNQENRSTTNLFDSIEVVIDGKAFPFDERELQTIIDGYFLCWEDRNCMYDEKESFISSIQNVNNQQDQYTMIFLDDINLIIDVYSDFASLIEKLVQSKSNIYESVKLVKVNHGEDFESGVAAASIIAKVVRDRFMNELSKVYPLYEFDKHKGYGTKRHKDTIVRYGISPIHRKSFKPVKYFL